MLIYSHTYNKDVSRFPILRGGGGGGTNMSEKGVCLLKKGHSIQMLYTILQKKGDLPDSSQKFGGPVVNFGGIPHP